MEYLPSDLVGRSLAQLVAEQPGAQVVDIGGGSGTRAVPLAQAGCSVLVVDASTDALASLDRRSREAGVADRISALQADADQLTDVLADASADLVLYHHVVQAVDDPARSLRAAVAVLRPGGRLSVLVPGRLSAVLTAAVGAQWDQADTALRGDPMVDRLFDVPALRDLMETAGVVVESVSGVGVFSALATPHLHDAADERVVALESACSTHPVLRQIATDLHGIGVRPAR